LTLYVRVASAHPLPSHLRLTSKGVVQAGYNCQPHCTPPSPDNLLVREPNTHVPGQMPQAIEAVEEEREREESLDSKLDSCRPSCDSSDHGLCLHVPSSDWCGEVGETEEVQRARENDAGDTVKTGCVPGDLGLVDCEMRGDGALEALFGEDLVGFGLRGRESKSHVSVCIAVRNSNRKCCVCGGGLPYLRCTMRPAG
jgi:hypothetical protein